MYLLGSEGFRLIMQRDDARRPEYGFSQPAHAEEKQQYADTELKDMNGNMTEKRAQGGNENAQNG
jgi:hypothetical protein